MKDQELDAFVVAIERYLSSRKGAEHVLSPPDFALAREWHAAGVPLAVVFAGIDRAFEREDSVSSLQRCRRYVLGLASGAARSAGPAQAEPSPEDLLARLQALRSAIVGVAHPVLFERAERRLAELIDLTSVARQPNWDYLRQKLEELDALVDTAAVEALPPVELESLQAEARRSVLRQRVRERPTALEEARLRYLSRRARERFALPRVSGD